MFSVNRRFPLFRKLVIAVFSIPLMFAGGSFLGGLAQSQTIGAVGSIDIPRNEYALRYQNAVEEYRRRSGSDDDIPVHVAQRISNEVRNDLLSYYLMKVSLEQKGVHAPDAAVAAEIKQTPDFQDEDGNFSPALYKEFITDRHYYQERVRESIGQEPVLRAMNHLPQEHIRDKLAEFRSQKRVVDSSLVSLSEITTLTLNIPPDDVNLYYQRNNSDYFLREEADFEYFVFSLDDFAADYTVSAEDVDAAYEDYIAEREELYLREVSHIYVADEEQANEIAAEAMESPERFAELAAEYSEDIGSAEAGGSLGIVADGDLPLSLNEALFTMVVGQVHEPVETEEGGFSILKLNELIGEELPQLDDIRSELEARARRALAQDDYDAQVEELRELAPIEIGSLASMAVLVSAEVTVQMTVYREAADNNYPFNSDDVLIDAFDELVITDNENSAPIALDDDGYLFVRAARYQAAGVQPLAEVIGEITDILRATYIAGDLITQLEALSTPQTVTTAAADESLFGDVIDVEELLETVEWQQTHTVALTGADEAALNSADGGEDILPLATGDEEAIDDLSIDRIYSADISRGLPVYVFVPQAGELTIYRITDVIPGEPQASDYAVIDGMMENISGQLAGLGYLDSLTRQYNYEFFNLPPVTQ